MGTLGSVKFANDPNRLIRIKMVRFDIAIKIRRLTYANKKMPASLEVFCHSNIDLMSAS